MSERGRGRAPTAVRGIDGSVGSALASIDAPDPEEPPFVDVLCAVDGTRPSLAGVSQAAQIAGPGAHVTLLAVTAAGSGPPLFRSAAISSLRVGRVLDRAAGVAADAGVAFDRVVDPDGPPAAVIVKRAMTRDLLAIGAPARSPLGGFGGGVATATLRSFTTPLLLARPAVSGAGTLDRVIVATDGSDSSDEVVSLAARLPAGRGGEAILVHALGSESQSQPHRVASQQGLLARACDGRASAVTEPGDACEVLLAVARRAHATLVVLGSRKRGGIGAVLGGVSRRTVHLLPCSALLIPPQLASSAK